MPIITPQSPQMFHLETLPGDWINHVCAGAYREKQSHRVDFWFDFNGIKLDTTMADDADGLVKVYDRLCEEQAAAYRLTPAYAALQERRRKEEARRAAYLAKPQRFPIAAVISAYTGRVVCDIGDVYKVLDYMTGESLFSHQIPRAAERARPHLLAQVPALARVDVANLDAMISKVHDGADRAARQQACAAWLEVETSSARLPKTVTLRHVPGFAAMDPIAELSAMLTPEN